MASSVGSRNQHSTRLSQELEAGVKCKMQMQANVFAQPLLDVTRLVVAVLWAAW